jgi:hypothetical protein
MWIAGSNIAQNPFESAGDQRGKGGFSQDFRTVFPFSCTSGEKVDDLTHLVDNFVFLGYNGAIFLKRR